ncbi:PepSY domain-containing protein [bacterium]|nr:PepSY domain-containing protein [bacterium]
MKLFFRNWHRWVSIFVAVPFSVTVITGIIMATRGFNTWVQPSYPEFKSELKLSFDDILNISKSVPEAKIASWKDVSQIDIRPATGNIRVRSKVDMWELQIDGSTGEIKSSAKRRQSFLVSLHEGAYFGPIVRYGLFFPSAIGVFFLLISGIYLAVKHYQPRIKRKRAI